jgi:hypothetical protein
MPDVKSLTAIGITGILPTPLTVKEHSTLMLRCYWRPGIPPKNASLWRNGQLLEAIQTNQPVTRGNISHVDYVMEDIQCWQGGNFSCLADNASRNQSLILTVLCKHLLTPPYDDIIMSTNKSK